MARAREVLVAQVSVNGARIIVQHDKVPAAIQKLSGAPQEGTQAVVEYHMMSKEAFDALPQQQYQ